MNRLKEKPIEYFLEQIPGGNAVPTLELHKHLITNYPDAKGSSSKHQAWIGGYYRHVQDILNLSEQLYPVLSNFGKVDYKVEDTYLPLYLHDLEKPTKYTSNKTEEVLILEGLSPTEVKKYFVDKFDIILPPDTIIALKYIHGEGDDYGPERKMTGLAAHCHAVDTFSARIFYDKDRPNI